MKVSQIDFDNLLVASIKNPWVLWSSKLSPFAIKIASLLSHSGIHYQWFPEDATPKQARLYYKKMQWLKANPSEFTAPILSKFDELPLVPYVMSDEINLVDSTQIGQWLNRQASSTKNKQTAQRLHHLLGDTPLEAYLMRLIEESMDEIGLYMVHHNRWTIAAKSNDVGKRLASEMKPLLGWFNQILRFTFPHRQTNRLAYLFSIAPQGTSALEKFGHSFPRPHGFPETHTLLNEMFDEFLSALEATLSKQSFIFGDYFTLADASVIGQLGMNYTDPLAWEMIKEKAPCTAKWVERNYLTIPKANSLLQDEALQDFVHLKPLIRWCYRYFVPLMESNLRAYQALTLDEQNSHENRNEKAFNHRKQLFSGELNGQPYRCVVKRFQVKVWKDLVEMFSQLSDKDKVELSELIVNDDCK